MELYPLAREDGDHLNWLGKNEICEYLKPYEIHMPFCNVHAGQWGPLQVVDVDKEPIRRNLSDAVFCWIPGFTA